MLSAGVLASARRWRFRFYFAAAWALGAFFLPFVVLPLYLIARASAKRQIQSINAANEAGPDQMPDAVPPVRFRFAFPFAYGCVLLSLLGFCFYRDYNNIDAHLARAVQAKLVNKSETTIREYRAALALEDNPHTHKLLGIELAEANQPAEALREFRLAESGGEPDETLPFRIGQALDAASSPLEAMIEYRRFLENQACRRILPDDRCAVARARLQSASGK